MKTYNIYNMQTDELIGTVDAYNVDDAEWKAAGKFSEYRSDELCALSD